MKIAVGFITYNELTAKYLEYFLPSLKKALSCFDSHDYKIYAYDNSSEEDSSNRLVLSKDGGIKLLGTGRNLGFARAYNLLINRAIEDGAEYFFVINPDIILEPEAISLLVKSLDNDGSLGSVAPKILRWNFLKKEKTNIIDSLGLALLPGLKFIDRNQGLVDDGLIPSTVLLGPSGAAGLFRLSALEAVAINVSGQSGAQYFDENFFMYKEDCDLAYRLFLVGFGSRLVADAVIYHDRTAAISGGSWLSFWRDRQNKSKQVRIWSFRNQHYLFVKHWKKQGFSDKIRILTRAVFMFIFSLILEQFLLKEYIYIFKFRRMLTNIK